MVGLQALGLELGADTWVREAFPGPPSIEHGKLSCGRGPGAHSPCLESPFRLDSVTQMLGHASLNVGRG